MQINTLFDIGEEVYVKNDPEQVKRTIVELKVLPKKLIWYAVAIADFVSYHYDFELTREKDQLLHLRN